MTHPTEKFKAMTIKKTLFQNILNTKHVTKVLPTRIRLEVSLGHIFIILALLISWDIHMLIKSMYCCADVHFIVFYCSQTVHLWPAERQIIMHDLYHV